MVGDCHGDTRFIQQIYGYAHKQSIDRIIQLGDLGWAWPGSQASTAKTILWGYKQFGIPFWWLPGNHDNYDFLPPDECPQDQSVPLGPFPQAAPRINKAGVFAVRPGEEAAITYLPRGSRFTIGKTVFGALGGAYSIDKEYRLELAARGKSHVWWPQEIPPPFTAERLIAGGPIDILLSHDAPLNVEVFSHHRFDHQHWPESRQVRRLLQDVVDACAPAYCYHGHHHTCYDEVIASSFGNNRDCEVHGLGFNYGPFWEAIHEIEVDD